MPEVTLTIKFSNSEKVTVTADTSITVADFKARIAGRVNVPAEQQRLIHKGRVLKDDSTLEHYEVQESSVIHLVRGPMPSGSSPSPAPTPLTPPQTTAPAPTEPSFPSMNPFAGMGMGGGLDIQRMQEQLMRNPEMMQSILSSPMMQSVMNNPELLRGMMMNNPQMQQILQSNPQLSHILNDPQLMRQTMEMLRNPAAMREMLRTQDLAMSHLENHPEGFNALRRMYEEVQEPLMQAAQDAAQLQGNPWASAASTASSASVTGPSSAPNTSALPNPWAGGAARASTSAPRATPGAAPTTAQADPFSNPMAAFGGAAMDPSAMSAMMSNPMMQQMISQMMSDPTMLDNIISSNPALRGIIDSNPAIRASLTNPQFMQRMADPANLQAIMQMQQAMQQLQRSGLMPALPGVPAMPGMAGIPGMPPMPASTPATAPSGDQPALGLDFSSLLGVAPPFAPVPVAAVSDADRYATQLGQLEAMGFNDREANLRALIQTNGNVNAAVQRLLDS